MSISQTDAEAALDWLHEHAEAMGVAEAHVTYTDEWRRVTRAQIMSEPDKAALSVSAQEREAYRDPRYHASIKAYTEALQRATELRWRARAMEARISAWQTQSRLERS